MILVIGNQIWSLVGVGLLAAISLVAIFTAYGFPGTTAEGENQAMPWRGYLEGLKAAKGDPTIDLDLDEAMPYAVAMNAAGELDKRLKSASKSGYTPAWLGMSTDAWAGIGFYPYWAAFHTSVSPTVGTGAGGAAVGSGGSGGGF